jgi:putative tricarboxylic transport membrane protein
MSYQQILPEAPETEHHPLPPTGHQTWIGVGVLVVGLAMAYGATQISSDAGYAGVGPNFLPWVVSVVLILCGILLVREARTGGYRSAEAPSGAAQGDWKAMAWVSAGVLLNASLITTIGFVLSCALCFVLAVRGLRLSEGKAGGSLRTTAIDLGVGLAIAAPVFWLFTRFLAINLPGLTASGWI